MNTKPVIYKPLQWRTQDSLSFPLNELTQEYIDEVFFMFEVFMLCPIGGSSI